MDINHDLYKVFYFVAKYGSFTRAAEKMLVSQSAITQSIKKLEDELDVKLFIRSRNGATLTYEGEKLFEYVSNSIETLNHADELFSQYKNLEGGNIRIACGSTLANIFLVKALNKFTQKYPKIKISVENTKATQALKKLSMSEIDVLITSYNSNIKYDNLDVYETFPTHECFFTTKDYFEKIMKMDNNIENINKYTLVLPLQGTSYREIIKDELKEKNIEISSNYEFSSAKVLIKFVEGTGGIGMTSREYIKSKLEEGKLIELYKEIKFPTKSTAIVTLKKKLIGRATKEFVNFLLEK